MIFMMFSIIIPTFNRNADILIRAFDSIQYQEFPEGYEILLIDQSTMPSFWEANKKICEKYGAKYFYAGENTSLTYSRNFGVKEATGDIVLFLDDDVELLCKDFLATILNTFNEHPSAVGVSGIDESFFNSKFKKIKRKLVHFIYTLNLHNKNEITSYFYNMGLHSKPAETIEADWLYGFCMAYYRSLFKDIQFDENLKKYSLREDADFSYRAKEYGTLHINPKASLHHHEQGSVDVGFRTKFAMELAYWSYLYWKNMKNPSMLVVLIVTFTIFIRYLLKAVLKLSIGRIKDVFSEYAYLLRNLDAIKKREIEVFNIVIVV